MSLKRGIFYTLLTQAPTLLLFFVASTLMTRLLGDEGRGGYALLTNQVALLSMLLWLNLGFGITYFTSKGSLALPSIVGTAASMLLVNLVVTPLVLGAIYLVDPLRNLFMPGGSTGAGYYFYVFLSVITGLINAAIAAVLLGLKNFKALNAMSIVNAALSAGGFLLLFLIKGDQGSAAMLEPVLIVSAVVMILISGSWCVLYGILVRIPPIPVHSWQVLRPLLVFSLVGYASNLINLINYRFDVWVVDQYHGIAALGLYSVAFGLAQLLYYIPEPFSRVVQPFLYGQDKDEMLSRYKAVARANFTTVLVLAMAMAVMSPWLVPLMFGGVFSASVLALQLLLPGIILSSATKLLAQLVVQGGMQKFNLYATTIGAVLTIILDLLLIPVWGIEGAAIASSISYLSIFLVVIGVIRYRMGIPVHDLFLIRLSDMKALTRTVQWRPTR